MTDSLLARFHRSYEKKESGCWEWLGYLDRGYGSFRLPKGHKIKAHKLSWLIHGGEVQEGQVIRHLVCDNRACVNPEHLAVGTQQDNVDDMMSKGRHGSKLHKFRFYSAEQKQRIYSAWDSGRTAREIAEAEDLSIEQVRGLLSRRKVPKN